MLPILLGLLVPFVEQDVARLRAEETLRIGHLTNNEQALSEIAGVLPAVSTVWIGQPQAGSIAVFGLDGGRTGTIGRKGNGPGEFVRIASLSRVGDSIAVADVGNGRTTLFVDGELRGTWPPFYPPDRNLLPGPALQVFGDGTVLARGSTLARARSRFSPLFVSHSVSRSARTIAELDRKDSGLVAADEASGLRMYLSPPVHSADLWDAAPYGVAILERGSIAGTDSVFARLLLLAPRGDTLLSVRFAGPARPIPKGFYDQEAEELADLAAEGRPFPRALLLRMIKEAVPRYGRQPLFDDLVAGEDEVLWLRESAAGASTARWLAFSLASKAVVATVELDAGADVVEARERELWAVVAGTYGEPYVVRYTLEPQGDS